MAIWHRHAGVAYAAVFLGVLGHASSEFVSVLTWMQWLAIGIVCMAVVVEASWARLVRR